MTAISLISIALCFFSGIFAGIFTGLIPGIHINLIALSVASLSSSYLSEISTHLILIFIISMTITHTFLDFVPSILLGAPDEDNYLSILPGHQMLLNGKGYQAILYTLLGCSSAIILLLILIPVFAFSLGFLYRYIQVILPHILITTSIILILTEKNSKTKALLVFLLSGILGTNVLNLSIKEPLLPLFIGLFGTSSLLISLGKKQQVPKQEIFPIKEIFSDIKDVIKPLIASSIVTPIASFIPGMGSGQAATVSTEIFQNMNSKQFLILLGAINTIAVSISIIALYSLNKTRTGIAVAIKKIIPNLTFNDLTTITTTILITGIICIPLTIFLSKIFIRQINKLNYKKISLIVLIFLILITFYFSGSVGILVLITSTSLGIYSIQIGIKRIHLMGCLLIPTIMYYLLKIHFPNPSCFSVSLPNMLSIYFLARIKLCFI